MILRKVIENKNKTEKYMENNEKVYPCEEILGSIKTVGEFATFYENHKEDLDLVKATAELDFVRRGGFTEEKYNGFMLGLEICYKIFENSLDDVKLYAEEQEKKRKSVG
jgi:hypothetical protein